MVAAHDDNDPMGAPGTRSSHHLLLRAALIRQQIVPKSLHVFRYFTKDRGEDGAAPDDVRLSSLKSIVGILTRKEAAHD